MEHYTNPILYGNFKEKADIEEYSNRCIDEMHIK
jgi:hypothetical protein